VNVQSKADLPPAQKAAYVQDLFARISPWYDLLNHVLSLGIDIRWRRETAEALELGTARRVLDVCCGTGDLTLECARHVQPNCQLIGLDFCAPMVERARRKVEERAGGPRVLVGVADGLSLPLAAESCDRATVAFGIRNVADLDRALAEFARVLVPGGRLAILEFSRPRNGLFRMVYMAYFQHILPFIGQLVSGEADPYRYLPESVLRFPEREELCRRIAAAGFGEITFRDLSLGIATLYVARRPERMV
jgi:demethylmenaquinone methyltransferase/2-methoxy-6-polyprenyl-1,4-benzoquinol methylase